MPNIPMLADLSTSMATDYTNAYPWSEVGVAGCMSGSALEGTWETDVTVPLTL